MVGRTCISAALLVSALAYAGCGNGDDAVSASAEDASRNTTTAPSAGSDASPVEISTSLWKPGDGGRTALIRGTLGFTADGCPHLGPMMGVVWPADFTSTVKADGEQVVVTADGGEIHAEDKVVAGGAVAATEAGPDMPCIEPGTTLTLIQSEIYVNSGHQSDAQEN